MCHQHSIPVVLILGRQWSRIRDKLPAIQIITGSFLARTGSMTQRTDADQPSPNTSQRIRHQRRLANQRFRSWLGGAGQILALLLIACAIIWPAPVDREQLPAMVDGSDIILSHWPSQQVVRDTVADRGRLPLWNPYYGGGRPVAADPLATLFYPPTHLVHLFSLRDYFLLAILIHLVWGAAGMLLLARTALRLTAFPALVAAIAFMAAPRLIGHLGAGHLTMVQAASWLPWVALATWATVRRPHRSGPLLAGALAMLLLAGHPQIAYYGGLMVAGMSIWLVGRRWLRGSRQLPLASTLGLAGAGVLAMMLAAVHLIPLREFTINSTRQSSVETTDSIPILSFLKWLVVNSASDDVPHEVIFKPGSAVLVLAAIGALVAFRRALPLLLSIVLVAGLALGVNSPLFQLAAAVLPEFDRFRGVARIWFLALLPIALLAGLGTEFIARRLRGRLRFGRQIGGGICALIVGVSLVAGAQQLSHVGPVQPRTTPSDLALAVAQEIGSSRSYGVQRSVDQLSAVELGIEMADGQDPLLIASHVAFMQQAGGYHFEGYQLSIPPFEVYEPDSEDWQDAQPDARLLGLFDIGIVVSRTLLIDERLIQIGEVGDTLIYRNGAVAGRAYFVDALTGGARPTLDKLQPIHNELAIVSRQPEEIRMTLTAPRAGYLVFASPVFPGWRAEVDRRPVTVETIDGMLPAIAIAPGEHEVTYHYAPASLRYGSYLSITGLALAVAWFVIIRWRYRLRLQQRR